MRQDRILSCFPAKSQTNVSYDHRVDFGLGLIKHKEELIALPRVEGQTNNAELLGHVLSEILAATITQVFESNYSD